MSAESARSKPLELVRSGPAGGPGVVPNTSRSVAPAVVTDRTEKSSEETRYDAKVDETQTMTEAPRNIIRSLSASVNVPRSYLAAIFKAANKGKEPTDVEIDELSKPEIEKIIPQVKAAYLLQRGRIPARVIPAKMLLPAISIGTGASLGREGPTVQICAAIASISAACSGVKNANFAACPDRAACSAYSAASMIAE